MGKYADEEHLKSQRVVVDYWRGERRVNCTERPTERAVSLPVSMEPGKRTKFGTAWELTVFLKSTQFSCLSISSTYDFKDPFETTREFGFVMIWCLFI